jgi:hypothetical protein
MHRPLIKFARRSIRLLLAFDRFLWRLAFGPLPTFAAQCSSSRRSRPEPARR